MICKLVLACFNLKTEQTAYFNELPLLSCCVFSNKILKFKFVRYFFATNKKRENLDYFNKIDVKRTLTASLSNGITVKSEPNQAAITLLLSSLYVLLAWSM